MTPSATPPRRLLPWPGDGGPLLAAIWASLTHPGPDTARLLQADVIAPPAHGTGTVAVLAGPHPPPAATTAQGTAPPQQGTPPHEQAHTAPMTPPAGPEGIAPQQQDDAGMVPPPAGPEGIVPSPRQDDAGMVTPPAGPEGIVPPQQQDDTAAVTPVAWPEGIVPPDGFPNPVPPTTGGPGFG